MGSPYAPLQFAASFDLLASYRSVERRDNFSVLTREHGSQVEFKREVQKRLAERVGIELTP